jgi:hypothetical protein
MLLKKSILVLEDLGERICMLIRGSLPSEGYLLWGVGF